MYLEAVSRRQQPGTSDTDPGFRRGDDFYEFVSIRVKGPAAEIIRAGFRINDSQKIESLPIFSGG